VIRKYEEILFFLISSWNESLAIWFSMVGRGWKGLRSFLESEKNKI